ncbi:hypothetical protein TNCV_2850401 [Trichonephila clavipes]|nr:hypothetical protein TNCV_2850401 [Trichonephila clavipes]
MQLKYSLEETQNLISLEVALLSLRFRINASVGLPRVFFSFDLKSTENNQTHNENHLRQLALKLLVVFLKMQCKSILMVVVQKIVLEMVFLLGPPQLETTIKHTQPSQLLCLHE